MTMKYLPSICLFALLLSGCTKPNAMTNFSYNNFYAKSLQHTSKNDIVKNNDVIAMLNATYLNKVDLTVHQGNEEVFLVGIFITNKSDKIDESFSSDYSLTLNKLKANSIIKLAKDDKMFAKMPLYNPWAKYYIVKFSKNKLNKSFLENLKYKEKYTKFEYKTIELKLTKSSGEFTSLSFQKAH
ncbi:hypothetical protein A9Q76_05415 [Arcobacter sp. 31_11_sub10_T18]|nr:hypothetical protein A9Q76_05415 [Arcobacter sp. 31_11_sub10_T18]